VDTFKGASVSNFYSRIKDPVTRQPPVKIAAASGSGEFTLRVNYIPRLGLQLKGKLIKLRNKSKWRPYLGLCTQNRAICMQLRVLCMQYVKISRASLAFSPAVCVHDGCRCSPKR